ncbi:MAG: monomethylamine:corrinoid methyltransferase, partial [Firmicutes bacterium]|nr:monomethylamine:corrinoid methyltransferase [Bacillota bacterium]
NEIVNALVTEYEPMLGSVARGENLGSRWDECYDIERLVPTPDYYDLVQRMHKKMEGFGLNWDILKTEC